ARWQIEFIMHHQDGFGRDLVKIGQRSYRLPATVHECAGLEQPGFGIARPDLAGLAEELGFLRQLAAAFIAQLVYPPEAGVMARGFIFRSRISQACNESDASHWMSMRLNENARPGCPERANCIVVWPDYSASGSAAGASAAASSAGAATSSSAADTLGLLIVTTAASLPCAS